MTNRYFSVDYVPVVWAAVFLAACGEDASLQPGDTDAAIQARDAATGAAADVGNNGGVVGRRCDLPAGWPMVFADWKGYVGWATTDGTQCANILVDPDQGLGTFGVPVDIALDDEYLYLLPLLESSYSGKLYRIARPMVGL